jgi:hypothetical protein
MHKYQPAPDNNNDANPRTFSAAGALDTTSDNNLVTYRA